MRIELDKREEVLLELFYNSKKDIFRYTQERLSKNIRNLNGVKDLGRKGLVDAITGQELLDKNIINQNIKPSQTYYFISKKGFEYVNTIRD